MRGNNEILIFPHSSLWAFVPPLMIFDMSLCFPICRLGTQMKGLVGLLISWFSSDTASVVVFGFYALETPWWPEPERGFSKFPKISECFSTSEHPGEGTLSTSTRGHTAPTWQSPHHAA